MMIWLKEVGGSANVFLFFFLMVIINWLLMSKLLVYAIICIKSFFFTNDMVFVGCALPSCPKSRNLVVSLYCSLNMLEGGIGYASYFMHFFFYFFCL